MADLPLNFCASMRKVLSLARPTANPYLLSLGFFLRIGHNLLLYIDSWTFLALEQVKYSWWFLFKGSASPRSFSSVISSLSSFQEGGSICLRFGGACLVSVIFILIIFINDWRLAFGVWSTLGHSWQCRRSIRLSNSKAIRCTEAIRSEII